MPPVRILIADDHELIRRGLAAMLAGHPNWLIVAEAANGKRAAELAQEFLPDIAILDLTMPELNGLEATRKIRASSPRTRVLIVTAHESEQLVREVLDAGALGYVLKSDAGRVLVQAVESLSDSRPYFTSRVARLVLEGYLGAGIAVGRGAASALSPREREIVQHLAEGKTNKQIASALHLSVKTVETHRGNIMRKMEFSSVADLVRYAIRNGIVNA
ncbi:MAG: response regulator transcription factor [Steroidobacteraceae bacterium]